MKSQHLFFFFLALVICPRPLSAQIDEQLRADVRSTGFIHSPLKVDRSKSYDALAPAKTVLMSDILSDMETLDNWSHRGVGGMSLTNERAVSGKHSLRLVAPARSPEFPTWGMGFGSSMASFDVGGANWEKYNRITFNIYPDCEGARSLYLFFIINNEGEITVPDEWRREGMHEINLINRQWNQCFLEMPALPRDKVASISLSIETFGKELTMGDVLQFDIDAISLQLVENPEVVKGWVPAENRIIYSTTGYGIDSEKSAIVRVARHDGTFTLIDCSNNKPVHKGKIKTENAPIGTFETIDFSNFKKEGQYLIKVGEVSTAPFYINKNIWDNSAWRALNFMFCQRCGYPVPEKHSVCHSDLNGEYNGLTFTFHGGWHDAGDMAQNAKQTAEIAFAMFEMANRAKEKGDTDLHARMLEEAQWGLDYILRGRLEDGYRVSGVGTNLWSDGFIGTMDDIGRRQLRIRNGAWENFIHAGVAAYASLSLEKDLALKEFTRKAAKEDFGFALKQFEEVEKDVLLSGERPTRVSPSQLHATISWAASMLYKLTNDPYYAEKAAQYIQYTLNCQRTEPIKDKDKTCGFFYQNHLKKSIVHFNHQTDDQIFMQALTALCETQPQHKDFKTWDKSIRLYASYLKNIFQYVQPYGMIPSGAYHIDEVKDSLAFRALQIRLTRDATQEYREQLENGFKLDDEHYVRIFPVWFSYRGNTAVHLATGKAAALCGKYLKDKEMMNIAEQQLFWVVGKNPFGQSLINGEGNNYGQLYCALPGETVGQMPVGMQTQYNEDTPYWPQFNTATYKEVWGVTAGKWISLISEF